MDIKSVIILIIFVSLVLGSILVIYFVRLGVKVIFCDCD